MGNWQETLTPPEDGEHVIVWCPGHWDSSRKVFEAWCFQDAEGAQTWQCYEIDGSSDIVQPAYWMPFPEPAAPT